jgi:hypothetical protein
LDFELYAYAYLSNHGSILVGVRSAHHLARVMNYIHGNISRELGRKENSDWRGPFFERRGRPILVLGVDLFPDAPETAGPPVGKRLESFEFNVHAAGSVHTIDGRCEPCVAARAVLGDQTEAFMPVKPRAVAMAHEGLLRLTRLHLCVFAHALRGPDEATGQLLGERLVQVKTPGIGRAGLLAGECPHAVNDGRHIRGGDDLGYGRAPRKVLGTGDLTKNIKTLLIG